MGTLGQSEESEYRRFWRTARNNLALPLLIGSCEEASLELPPFSVGRPMGLKLKLWSHCLVQKLQTSVLYPLSWRYLVSIDDLYEKSWWEELKGAKRELVVLVFGMKGRRRSA